MFHWYLEPKLLAANRCAFEFHEARGASPYVALSRDKEAKPTRGGGSSNQKASKHVLDSSHHDAKTGVSHDDHIMRARVEALRIAAALYDADADVCVFPATEADIPEIN